MAQRGLFAAIRGWSGRRDSTYDPIVSSTLLLLEFTTARSIRLKVNYIFWLENHAKHLLYIVFPTVIAGIHQGRTQTHVVVALRQCFRKSLLVTWAPNKHREIALALFVE